MQQGNRWVHFDVKQLRVLYSTIAEPIKGCLLVCMSENSR